MKIHIIQHVPFESPGSILEWAKKREATVQYTNVFNGDFYPGDIDFDLLVVMGGPMGANDDEQLPWITDEKKFIGRTLSSGRKTLGICLGSQLLASVLEARVYVNKEKEIGWWPVQTNKEADHALLNGWPAEWTCFHWHADTYDLPEGAVRLFSTSACRNQGYIYKKQALGLQFHMEATPELVAGMIRHGGSELIPSAFVQDEATIASHSSCYEQNSTLLHQLLDDFIQL